MPDHGKYKEDAAYIITALRSGLDYSKIDATMIALMQLVENYWQARQWEQSDACCQQLELLASDSDYRRGIARVFQGAHFLGRGKLDAAIDYFGDSQPLFKQANALHSEAVALLAKGIISQRKYELGNVYAKKSFWTEILKTFQDSLTIFRSLGDRLQVDVRDKLAEVQDEFQKDLVTRKSFSNLPNSAHTQKARRWAKGIPVYDAAAGPPILTEEPEEFIAIDEITDRVTFALRVHGDSLIDDGILPDDLLLVEEKREDLLEGQIVAVTTKERESEESLIIKKYYKEKDHIRLEPANENEPFVIITPSELSQTIRDRYSRTTEVYSEEEAEIIGWAKTLIRNIGTAKD